MTAPTCPRCDEHPLQTVRMNGEPALSCRSCGGHAVGRKALKKASDPTAQARLWAALEDRSQPGALPCPRCRAPMHTAGHHGVEIDACLPCALVWFDPRERRASTRLPPRPRPDPALARQREEEAEREREQALAAARAGEGAHKTEPADVVDGILKILESLLA